MGLHYDSYIICTSPRSGSTLLCRLLQDTGIAGHPESWFHGPSITDWRVGAGLDLATGDLRDTLSSVIRQVQGRSEIFALRLQRQSFEFLMLQLAKLSPGLDRDADLFSTTFGRVRYIHLFRADVVAQAVSYVRASQTGLWHRNADGSEYERLAPPEKPKYNRCEIAKQVSRLSELNSAWLTWYKAQGLSPFSISYEDLSASPRNALAALLEDLGLDPQVAGFANVPTARLSDDVNLDWISRFRQGV